MNPDVLIAAAGGLLALGAGLGSAVTVATARHRRARSHRAGGGGQATGWQGRAPGESATAMSHRLDAPQARSRDAGAGAATGAASVNEPVDVGIADAFEVLRSGAVVLDVSDGVVLANPAAQTMSLVRDGRLVHPELRELARQARRDGSQVEAELDLPRGPFGEGMIVVTVRATRLGRAHVLLLVEDHTQARRVEAVRRDFVANVSHELKTPVGGIALLAEAVLDANDDPVAVSRFARRIKIESDRLTRLVQEIVDLSRLQASESADTAETVDIDDVVTDSLELMSTLAESHDTVFAVAVDDDVTVQGDHVMLRTALTNLLSNAIHYSAPRTRVAVTARRVAGDTVEITVADQGCGIAASDLERIFERFYRVDAARSRATGGTGLGLAIVKHICSNHGGEITVWSSEGNGSTFTIRLPAAHRQQVRAAGSPLPRSAATSITDPDPTREARS